MADSISKYLWDSVNKTLLKMYPIFSTLKIIVLSQEEMNQKSGNEWDTIKQGEIENEIQKTVQMNSVCEKMPEICWYFWLHRKC